MESSKTVPMKTFRIFEIQGYNTAEYNSKSKFL